MTDWNKNTGNGGTMRIRDTGSDVEFWLHAGSSITYAYQMPWRSRIHGNTSPWHEYRFESGSGWNKLGSWNITEDETVTFYLGDTGTSGLGGPTTFSHFIDRTNKPPHPTYVTVTNITDTTAYGRFDDRGDGGGTIDRRQIGYNKQSSHPYTIFESDGSTTVTGMDPGTKYYIWARVHNEKGWSDWGPRRSFKTLRVPFTMDGVELSDVTQTTVVGMFSPNGDGGANITEFQIGYGTNDSPADLTITSNSPQTITGLVPGAKYYFWVRAKNSVGWSAWSARSSITTIAGARVKVGSTYKDAVPYVNDNGVWKIARPWSRIGGVWKEAK